MSDALLAPYVAEYSAALDRTEALRLRPRAMRILVAKDCVNPDRTLSVLLDYFDCVTPAELVGQTAAINLALISILFDATGVPFELTIGWVERQGRACFRHDEELITRFLALKERPGAAKASRFISGSLGRRSRSSMSPSP